MINIETSYDPCFGLPFIELRVNSDPEEVDPSYQNRTHQRHWTS